MNTGTAPLHTVFGAGLSVLLANAAIMQISQLQELPGALFAFSAVLITAFSAELSFRKAESRNWPWLYLLATAFMSFSIIALLPSPQGRCTTASDGFLICVDLNPHAVYIAALQILWCVGAAIVGFLHKEQQR